MVNFVAFSLSSSLVLRLPAVNVSSMPLRMTPSKRHLPVAKRSSLRNKSYEVEPAQGRKVYPSRGYPIPVRPPPLPEKKDAAFQSLISPESAADMSPLPYDPV